MRANLIRYGALLSLTLITASSSFAAHHEGHGFVTPDEMKWSQGPNSLPAGSEITLLEGDPTKAGPFTLRLKFPANYRIQPHWHPVTEHVTVLSGSLYMGMGDQFDEKQAIELSTGSFAYMNAKVHHYAFTHDAAVIQLHGVGPWGITYINPKDDPRLAKKA
jgi:quercetin dioxygenase-like cupin family protein